MNVAAIWEFIAGDSRLAPVAVVLAIAVAVVLLRSSVAAGVVALAFPALIALGLAAAAVERR